MARRAYKLKAEKPKTREADVLEDVKQFLALKGWECLRTFPGRWIPYGEFWAAQKAKGFQPKPRTLHPTGIPDMLAVRPYEVKNQRAIAQFLWIELKRPGEKPDEHQRLSHNRLRQRGFRVVWCDGLTHGDGIEQPFVATYEELGLE